MDVSEKLQQIVDEPDLARKALKLSLLVASLFREVGSEIVVVGGSAIELYTQGDYMSGDVDICFHLQRRPELRVVADLMAKLDATGGPRSFKVGGLFVDVLGEVESLAATQFRRISGETATDYVLLAKPEDLLAERVLMSLYPSRDELSLACARKLIASCLASTVAVDWEEAYRVAALPEYRVEQELRALVEETRRSLLPPP